MGEDKLTYESLIRALGGDPDQEFSGYLDRLLDSFEVHYVPPFAWAVPRWMPAETKRRMLASVKSTQGGYSGVDYLLKRHGGKWDVEADNRSDVRRSADEMLSLSLRLVEDTAKWWTSVKDKEGTLGHFAAGAALLRLTTTFRSASLLNQLAHPYEAAALLRMALEQIAWAHAVSGRDDPQVLETSATKAVGPLKRVMPEAGLVYGLLSDWTHVGESWHTAFVRAESGDFRIVQKETQYACFLAWIQLRLADVYRSVSELNYHEFVDGAQAVIVQSGEAMIRDNRPWADEMENYWEQLKKMPVWPFIEIRKEGEAAGL